jgi:hypothetical protein
MDANAAELFSRSWRYTLYSLLLTFGVHLFSPMAEAASDGPELTWNVTSSGFGPSDTPVK